MQVFFVEGKTVLRQKQHSGNIMNSFPSGFAAFCPGLWVRLWRTGSVGGQGGRAGTLAEVSPSSAISVSYTFSTVYLHWNLSLVPPVLARRIGKVRLTTKGHGYCLVGVRETPFCHKDHHEDTVLSGDGSAWGEMFSWGSWLTGVSANKGISIVYGSCIWC